jgi:hypothetical protein
MRIRHELECEAAQQTYFTFAAESDGQRPDVARLQVADPYPEETNKRAPRRLGPKP